MGQQRIPAVEDVRDGVPLMLPQGNFRVHSGENDVRSVKLAGPGAVETLAVVGLHFLNAQGDFLDLILQQTLLPFKGNGDALKLAVADDHGVIIAGGDPGAELFSVSALKIPFGRDQDIGGGIQAQELAGLLLRQMVRHHEHGLLA